MPRDALQVAAGVDEHWCMRASGKVAATHRVWLAGSAARQFTCRSTHSNSVCERGRATVCACVCVCSVQSMANISMYILQVCCYIYVATDAHTSVLQVVDMQHRFNTLAYM